MARGDGGYERRVAGVNARIEGHGAPVLLMHGIGGCAASFAQQQGNLPGFTTIAWDAPGYGASADLPADPSAKPAERYAQAAVDLLRGLGYLRAHVVGVSWGGVIATRMALRHPDMLRSLTLVDSSRGSGRTVTGRTDMLRRVAELAEIGADAFARSRGPKLLAPNAPVAMVEGITATMARVRLAGYRGAAEMMAATDHSADLGRITVPTLVLVGAHDRVTGVAESKALAKGIQGARFVIVPGGGHAVHQENPSAFNAELCRFLIEIEREGEQHE